MGNWGYWRLWNFVLESPQERQHRGVMSTWTGRYYRSPRNGRATGTDIQYQVYGPRLGNEGLHVLKDGLFFVVGSGISNKCFLQSENQKHLYQRGLGDDFFPALFATRKTEKRRGGNASLTESGSATSHLPWFLEKEKKPRGKKKEKGT
ncbi:hypothetical protein J3458_009386 [Metarhizium acridum]|uniref:uncharacterized protein n=1 Tax=Metarhizium acridum TaxID=92637 RepID=UPI001C6BB97A|nr:hypothetical protein J3458_009386 [Metarhizium acridum]